MLDSRAVLPRGMRKKTGGDSLKAKRKRRIGESVHTTGERGVCATPTLERLCLPPPHVLNSRSPNLPALCAFAATSSSTSTVHCRPLNKTAALVQVVYSHAHLHKARNPERDLSKKVTKHGIDVAPYVIEEIGPSAHLRAPFVFVCSNTNHSDNDIALYQYKYYEYTFHMHGVDSICIEACHDSMKKHHYDGTRATFFFSFQLKMNYRLRRAHRTLEYASPRR